MECNYYSLPEKELVQQKIVLDRIVLCAYLEETRFSDGKYLKIEKNVLHGTCTGPNGG